jgi:hypothetical protein
VGVLIILSRPSFSLSPCLATHTPPHNNNNKKWDTSKEK